MTITRRVSATFASALGYTLLLMAFAALGLFVAAMATGSGAAAILGIGLIVCMAGSVTGFRAASRKLAQSTAIAPPTSAVSIFSAPLRQDQIDAYLENYRGATDMVAGQKTLTVLVGGDSKRQVEAQSAPTRLSA
jgi:thiol:disulfide interchange protein